jgi:hypothetical protein
MGFFIKKNIRIFNVLVPVVTILLAYIDKYGHKDLIVFLGSTILLVPNLIRELAKASPRRFKWLADKITPDIDDKIHRSPTVERDIKERLLREVKEKCQDLLKDELLSDFYEPEYILHSKDKATMTGDMLEGAHHLKGEGLFNIVITGSSGSGKTFVLAKWILARIKAIEAHQARDKDWSILNAINIPLYLPLSNWNSSKDKVASFEKWAIIEIEKQYDWVKKKTQNISWLIASHGVILCLDGLDEVMPDQIEGCLKGILDYAEGNTSLIFLCRKEHYTLLKEQTAGKLDLSEIEEYEISPYPEKRIKEIISAFDPSNKIVGFLERNDEIWRHLSAPLWLKLFLLRFSGLKEESMEGIDPDAFKALLIIGFEEYQFDRKLKYRDERSRIRAYTKSLANQMGQNKFFFIEQLQPSWLPGSFAFLYYFVSRILSGFCLALAAGYFIASPDSFIGNGIFASVAIAILTISLNRREDKKHFSWWLPPLLFTLVLVTIMTLYQGFSVPRQDKDMIGYFSRTESLSGAVVGIFLGAIFGFRRSRQKSNFDIRPIEILHFEKMQALKTGLLGGILIGLFVGGAALLVELFYSNTSFYDWLGGATEHSMSFMERKFAFLSPSARKHGFLFSLGFLAGFIIGGLLFVLMGGRGRKDNNDQKARGGKAALNVGIIKSLSNSFQYAIISLFVMSIGYGLFIFLLTRNPESFKRAVMVGIGTSIISLMWFGGFEVIQHWVLRICLYFSGVTPFRFGNWIKTLIDLGFVKPVGSGIQFYHLSFREHFKNIELDDPIAANPGRSGLFRIGISLFTIVSFFLLIQPFLNRYSFHYYWDTPLRTVVKVDTTFRKDASFLTVNDSSFEMLNSGHLMMKIDGKVNVGTFTGRIGPEGTESGFMGMSLQDVYDKDKSTSAFRHGALLYRITNRTCTQWQPVVLANRLSWFFRTRVGDIRVEKGDTLQLTLNDNEYQNNSAYFELSMQVDTSRKK